jgi:hypothetical protein
MPTYEVQIEDKVFEVDAESPEEARKKAETIGLTPRNQTRKATREAMGGFGGGFNQVVPWQDEIMATAATPIGMVQRHLAGEDKDESWADSIKNAWSEEHQNIEEQGKEYDARHPILSPVQNLVGGLGVVGPGANAVLRGGTALRPTIAPVANPVPRVMEATVPQRIGKGAAVGGGIGAAYGSGEGDNLEERMNNGAQGLAWGAGVGAGAQIGSEIAQAVGQHVVAPMRRTIQEPARQARSQLTRAHADDAVDGATRLPERGLTDGEYQWAADRNYPVGMVDKGGENVTGAFDAAYQASGQARNRINDFVAERDSSMARMTEDVINNMLPNPGDIARRRANLAAGRARTQPLYDQAFAHPNARNMWGEGYEQFVGSDVGQDAAKAANKIMLDDNALKGANRIKSPFVEEPVFVIDPQTGQRVNSGTTRMRLNPDLQRMGVGPNLQYWDYFKRGLDEVIEGGRDPIKGLSPKAKRARDIKGALVGHLDYMTRDPVSGQSLYARARTAAGQYLGEESAAAAGAKIYKEAKTPNKSLDSIYMKMSRWSDDEREEAAQSFLESLKDDMLSKSRAEGRDAGHVDISLHFLKSEKQRRVAEALLGTQRLRELEMHNMVQRVMQYRNKTARGNSMTERRRIGQDVLAPIAGGGLASSLLMGGDPTSMGAGALMGLLARHGGPAFKAATQRRLAPHIAQELIEGNPATYQEIVRTLAGDQQLANQMKLLTHPLRLAAGQWGGQ